MITAHADPDEAIKVAKGQKSADYIMPIWPPYAAVSSTVSGSKADAVDG